MQVRSEFLRDFVFFLRVKCEMKDEELRTGRVSDKELQFTNVAMTSTLKRTTNHGHLPSKHTNFYLLVSRNKQGFYFKGHIQ